MRETGTEGNEEELFSDNKRQTEDDFAALEKLKGKSTCYIASLAVMFGSGGYYFGYYMGIWNPLGEKYLRLVLKVDEEDINLYYGIIN